MGIMYDFDWLWGCYGCVGFIEILLMLSWKEKLCVSMIKLFLYIKFKNWFLNWCKIVFYWCYID